MSGRSAATCPQCHSVVKITSFLIIRASPQNGRSGLARIAQQWAARNLNFSLIPRVRFRRDPRSNCVLQSLFVVSFAVIWSRIHEFAALRPIQVSDLFFLMKSFGCRPSHCNIFEEYYVFLVVVLPPPQKMAYFA